MQSVASQNADPGVTSLTPAQSQTFMEIDHEIISTLIPLIQEGLLSTCYKLKYMREVLVNCLVKLAQEKSVIG